ncbi:hypothetical protein [Bordetella tumulicola]|uniref:hypothetical protein n=1 Tax=Bordetella tumulicola TaxID=1649133 RepID=UPI0039F149C7
MASGISNDHRIDMHLNNGMLNGRPLYIHYTSHNGHANIMMHRCIMARPNADRRGTNAKPGVYLALAKDAMNSTLAHYTLFLGEERYAQSATHCIIFTFHTHPFLEQQLVTEGGIVHEAIHRGNIPFHSIDVLFDGPNPFI